MLKLASKSEWTRVTFAEMAEHIAERVEPTPDDGETYVGLEHLDSGSLTVRRWGTDVALIGTKLRMRKGDILFARRNAYLRRVALAPHDGLFSAHGMVLRARPDVVLPEFLPFFMQSDLFMDRAEQISVGSLSPTINWGTLKDQEFALPPLQEQVRIASALGASSNVCEALRTLRGQCATLLKSAVDDVAERATRAGSVVPLQDLVQEDRPITYGILKPGTGFPGGVPVIKVKDFPDGRIIEEDLLLTDPAIDEEYKRSRLREADLLISIRGTIGRLAFVPGSLNGANITQDTARLSLRAENDAGFIRTMLGSSFVQRQIAEFTTGLAVKGINIGELRRVLVPITSVSQQAEFVREVAETRVAVEKCDERLKAVTAVHLGALRELTEVLP